MTEVRVEDCKNNYNGVQKKKEKGIRRAQTRLELVAAHDIGLVQ